VLFFNNVGEGWPDVIFLPPRNTAHVADAAHQYPADLLPWVPGETLDGFAHNSLAPCTIEGKLLCMRNDLAQTVLWYNVPLMEEFGYEVPTTWDEYLAIAEDVAANHPGYYMGVMNQSHTTFFWPSECAFVEEVDLAHVRIFDPQSVNCTRPAELLDRLLELGVMGASHNDAEFVAAASANRLIMMPWASWGGEHLFGGKENSLYYQTAEGQLGVAPPPKWPDQEEHLSGAIGGGAWAMSRHTKNPQLSSELVIWLTTSEEFQGATATTFPAYLPAAEIWAERVASNPMYAFDPYPVLEEQASKIWPVYSEGRYQDFVSSSYGEFVLNPAMAGEQSFVEGLPAMREELVNLAPTLGFQVIE
jgi:multiple sugar transport system substrate-binding protein